MYSTVVIVVLVFAWAGDAVGVGLFNSTVLYLTLPLVSPTLLVFGIILQEALVMLIYCMFLKRTRHLGAKEKA